jgi:hypothetical protein
MSVPRGSRFAVVLAFAALLTRPAAAESMALSADIQVPLLLRVLAYDRRLEAKAGSDLVIGIIHDPADKDSAKAADEISSTLYQFTKPPSPKTVKKLPIKYFLIEYTKPADLEAFVKAKGINMLYVTPGISRALPDIIKLSQNRHLTTTTGVPDYVRKGVAVGIGERQNRPQILVNVCSTKLEGSEFDASLLRIATVVCQ